MSATDYFRCIIEFFEQNNVTYSKTDTPGLLSGGGRVPFWVSWENSIIKVGQGHSKVPSPVLLQLTLPSDHWPINIATFATMKTDGYWHFPITYGEH